MNQKTVQYVVIGAIVITSLVCATLFTLNHVDVPPWLTFIINALVTAVISLYSADRGAKLSSNGKNGGNVVQPPQAKTPSP